MANHRRPNRTVSLAAIVLILSVASYGAEPKWLRISSDHFTVVTDGGAKKGHEVLARLEQMRQVFAQLLVRQKLRMSAPLEILAIENPATYAKMVPYVNGRPISAPGFFLPEEDRDYIVLNTATQDSWRSIEHPFAHYLLNYNYPPTPPWFDEGFAEYFSSLYFTPKMTELGSDPELAWTTQPNYSVQGPGLKSLTEILQSPVWLDLGDLLSMKNRVVGGTEGTHHTLFYAQSWILVHYLINRDKLSQAGEYFGLVQGQHLPIPQAVQQAFGMSIAELDRAVKDYFHSLKPLQDSLLESQRPNPPLTPERVQETPVPFTVEDVASSSKDVPQAEADALIAEMKLRVPELREQAIQDLQRLAADPKLETAVAHRALAWAAVQKADTREAFEQLHEAVELSPEDPWSQFGVALAAYHSAQKGKYIQGLANTMESLHFVLDQFPEFAEAYNILGWARLEGGGGNAAVAAMQMAVQLSPRDEAYQLRLARAYLAAKKFDQGTATLERLKNSDNAEIAKAAKKDLNDLPFLKKYGVSPEEQEARNQSAHQQEKESDDSDSESSEPVKKEAQGPVIDKRPVKFLQGSLVSVDCSQPPLAVLRISDGKIVRKMVTPDYKSMTLIGAKELSCDWKNMPVNVNYRPGGKADGDLVSLEVR